MYDLKIIVMDSSRQKMVITISWENKKKQIRNIEMGKMNLERWLHD